MVAVRVAAAFAGVTCAEACALTCVVAAWANAACRAVTPGWVLARVGLLVDAALEWVRLMADEEHGVAATMVAIWIPSSISLELDQSVRPCFHFIRQRSGSCCCANTEMIGIDRFGHHNFSG